MYRIRLVDFQTDRILWVPLRDGFLGRYSVDNPQVALMLAEGVLALQGDEFVSAKPAMVSGVGEPDIAGIMIRGHKSAVVIEGAEFFSFGYT